MKGRGLFVVLEGGEGGGKTSAIAYLGDALRRAGHDVVVTREPGGTREGQALRELLLTSDGYDWEAMAELLLVTASRIQHVERLIRPALRDGRVVLCDRYAGSTIAYQGAGRGLFQDRILQLHQLAIGDFWPDLTLVLDIAPEKGLARSRHRLEADGVDEGRFEGLDLAFHRRVRQSFLDQAAAHPERYAVIDADRTQSAVQEDALRHVLERIAVT